MINKNIIFCLEYFLLIFLVGCTAFKNVPGEEYQYEQLSETPGIDAYQAIETICSPEDAALMEEDFYEEAKLWRYAAQKEVFYPNIFDLQYQKGISFAEEKFSFK
ncbi:MAG: hypothetical protein E6066_03105 [Oscillospiraceae bacterium]|nr:hypothetical protein [Oscillospiraceae bacterium]